MRGILIPFIVLVSCFSLLVGPVNVAMKRPGTTIDPINIAFGVLGIAYVLIVSSGPTPFGLDHTAILLIGVVSMICLSLLRIARARRAHDRQ